MALKSHDKLKPLYNYYNSVNDHQTWHDGDLQRAAANRIVTQPFGHVFLYDHVRN